MNVVHLAGRDRSRYVTQQSRSDATSRTCQGRVNGVNFPVRFRIRANRSRPIIIIVLRSLQSFSGTEVI